VPLVAKIAAATEKPDIGILKRPYDVAKQRLFAESVAAAFGYDFAGGRLDEVTHPFCTGIGPGDVRICTRYYPEDLAEGLTGVTHETGHGLYETGLLPRYHGTPLGEAVSSAIHESQSRLWENQVGRSRSFWCYFFPQAQRVFRDSLKGVDEEDLYRAFNFVAPSYIRVEADEATYNLHIMLRFEMERALIRRELAVKDIPGEWNARFREYLGIEVDRDSHGCLQDVHWSAGLFGYFPSYALGNLYAAQFFAAARTAMPDMDDCFAVGDFSGLLGWLRTNIHSQGQRFSAGQLCEKVTGRALSHRPLIDYLYEKYRLIYGISR
jgi:carboxypeptidase Taq